MPKPGIFTGKDSLQQFFNFLSSYSFSMIFVLVDENTLEYCYPQIEPQLPKHFLIQILSGEENKTLTTCETVWQKLTNENADRNSLLINLGGGVIGDLGGFAAGCYKRGIKFVNFPTTLLAMVDASVGSKTGIDFLNFKNQIGLFNEPEAVFIYTGFLETLPEGELLSGFAEVIKHYLIADVNEFEKLHKYETKITELNWGEIVEKNITIKSKIVEQDPFEKNIRKALNFGHTIGHAVESCFLQKDGKKLLHGEAVAVGMICEIYLSLKKELINEDESGRAAGYILRNYKLPEIYEEDFEQILQFIKQDKKNATGQAQFTLLKGIGGFSIDNNVNDSSVIESLRYYNFLFQ